MRILILCMALAGCAAAPIPAEPIPQKKAAPRDCPPLPVVPRGADRNVLLHIIGQQAELYERCAKGDD